MMNNSHHDERIAKMTFASVYLHYVAKVEKKGRTKEELHQVTRRNKKKLKTSSRQPSSKLLMIRSSKNSIVRNTCVSSGSGRVPVAVILIYSSLSAERIQISLSDER